MIYDVIERKKHLNHFITLVSPEEIEKQEKESKGKLEGYYFSLKDCLCVKNFRTTAGSRILENYYPPFSATVYERLKKEGAIFIGKTNMDEFGFGSFGTNSAFGPARNPIDEERVTGGSSSGAGGSAKLLEDHPYFAIAESTGGSIANPAAFCSVYGLTPTYGVVSRWGLISYADSLDKVGVIASNPILPFKVLEIISGPDGKDSTCIAKYEMKEDKVEKIAVVDFDVDKKVREAFIKKVEEIEERFKVEYISLDFLEYALWSYYIIAMAEASSNLARYCGMIFGVREDPKGKDFFEYFSEIRSKYFGEEAKRRIIVGTLIRTKGYRGKYYIKALKVRRWIIKEYKKIFKKYDIILTPTMPILPPKIEEVKEISPVDVYKMDILTVPPNLAGLPHYNIPIGKMMGMMAIADHFRENKLLTFVREIGEEK